MDATRSATFLSVEVAEDEPHPAIEDVIAYRIDPARDPVSLTFASTRGRDQGGRPHVVTVLNLAGGDILTCSCAAVRSLGYRPAGCFAMVRAREILNMPDLPEGGE